MTVHFITVCSLKAGIREQVWTERNTVPFVTKILNSCFAWKIFLKNYLRSSVVIVVDGPFYATSYGQKNIDENKRWNSEYRLKSKFFSSVDEFTSWFMGHKRR
jgi:hypothetical protein